MLWVLVLHVSRQRRMLAMAPACSPGMQSGMLHTLLLAASGTLLPHLIRAAPLEGLCWPHWRWLHYATLRQIVSAVCVLLRTEHIPYQMSRDLHPAHVQFRALRIKRQLPLLLPAQANDSKTMP